MGLRIRRRNIVVWSSSSVPRGRYRLTSFPRPAGTPRPHRLLRIGGLLTLVGLLRLARALRLRWLPVLAGVVLTVTGVVLRGGAGSLAVLPGMLFLYSALIMDVTPRADRERRFALERELAGYSTPAQRRDLEATLDRYSDGVTKELRDILAR